MDEMDENAAHLSVAAVSCEHVASASYLLSASAGAASDAASVAGFGIAVACAFGSAFALVVDVGRGCSQRVGADCGGYSWRAGGVYMIESSGWAAELAADCHGLGYVATVRQRQEKAGQL